MILSQMDLIRGAIAQAIVENLTLHDLWLCAEHAASTQGFSDAVNELAHMQPIAENPATE